MRTQIKKWGDSNVLVLSLDFKKYHNAEVGDWVDLTDVKIIKNKDKNVKPIN